MVGRAMKERKHNGKQILRQIVDYRELPEKPYT